MNDEYCCLCRRSKSSSRSPHPAAGRRAENNVGSGTASGESRSRRDKKDRGIAADSRVISRHSSSADIRKSSPSYSDSRRSKKSARPASPPRQRSPSASPDWVSTKHKRSKAVSSPIVLLKPHKRNGHRRRDHSRSKERRVHSAADRRR